MNYLSVCSGIEAATVAWHHMGWKPLGFSEIEKFPSQVLAHHYPDVTNFGDMTKYKEWKIDGTVGLLVGGTPCQSFSVAGLRKGLDDPRGNLALTYCGILDHFRPKWFVWENVPGVLSSGRGRDFGAFLGAVAELGYGFSYRVLDSQYFGVAQRRRRVFVVGHLGDWRPTAKVLFESDCLRRDSAKGRSKRKDIAKCLTTSVRNDYETESFVYENHPSDSRVKEMGDVCQTVTSSWGMGGGNVPFVRETYSMQGNLIGRNKGGLNGVGVSDSNTMYTLTKTDVHAVAFDAYNSSVTGNITKTLDTGSDYHHVPIAFSQFVDTYNGTIQGNISATMTADMAGPTHSGPKVMVSCIGGQHPNAAIGEEISPTVTARWGAGGNNVPLTQNIQIEERNPIPEHYTHQFCQDRVYSTEGLSPALNCSQSHKFRLDAAVRRLTEVECERLQGFPDNYTNIRENCPSGARYKALGNSMAVPVMRWIGERINQYEQGI